MNRLAFALRILLAFASMAPSTLLAAEPAAPRPNEPDADFSAVRNFFRVCVLAKDGDDARARARELGGRELPENDSFAFDFDGTPARVTFAPAGLCMLEVPSIDIKRVRQQFAIALQIQRPGEWDYDIVYTREAEYDGYTEDQSRPSIDGRIPNDAVVREREEVVSREGRNVRLLVLSKLASGNQGSVFLISEIHADAAIPAIPAPPRPPGSYRHSNHHQAVTFPSEAVDGRLAYPLRYPASAVTACAYGLVRLRVGIDAAGTVLGVDIDRSSGHADLDAAAVDAASHWKFIPGTIDGQPVGGEFILPVNFNDPCKPAE
jgi:TonB family protein